MTTTPTGVPITLCRDCGLKHPTTRHHCAACGRTSLFLDATATCPPCCDARDAGPIVLRSGSLLGLLHE